MPAAGEWSESQCLAGDLRVHGIDTPLVVVRNTGGGSSECCHYYPVAAPARVSADGLAVDLQLLNRRNFHDMHKPLRNGARAYLADHCVESQYISSGYVSWQLERLLGSTISVTIDLSAAACGCAASFALAPMHWSSEPGVCDGDYYCNPSATCGVSCAELALFEANRHAFKTRAHSAMGPVGLGARARARRTHKWTQRGSRG